MTYYGLSNSNGRNVVIAYAILGAFSTMTTLLRLLSRRVLGLSYMLDDYLVVGANVSLFVSPAATQLMSLSLMINNTCLKRLS